MTYLTIFLTGLCPQLHCDHVCSYESNLSREIVVGSLRIAASASPPIALIDGVNKTESGTETSEPTHQLHELPDLMDISKSDDYGSNKPESHQVSPTTTNRKKRKSNSTSKEIESPSKGSIDCSTELM